MTNNNPSNLIQLTQAEHCKITLRPFYDSVEHKAKLLAVRSAKTEVVKTCPVCTKEFTTNHKKIYCSVECKRRSDNITRAGSHRALKNCIICTSPFMGTTRQRTCSFECSRKNAVNIRTKWNERAKYERQSLQNHKVRFIRPCASADVYDIEVPMYHNFVAEGIVVHNSHIATACEYLAVYLRRKGSIDKREYAKPVHNRLHGLSRGQRGLDRSLVRTT